MLPEEEEEVEEDSEEGEVRVEVLEEAEEVMVTVEDMVEIMILEMTTVHLLQEVTEEEEEATEEAMTTTTTEVMMVGIEDTIEDTTEDTTETEIMKEVDTMSEKEAILQEAQIRITDLVVTVATEMTETDRRQKNLMGVIIRSMVEGATLVRLLDHQ